VSHNDTDHSGGMPVILAQMPVAWLLSSLPDSAALNPDVQHIRCFAGQRWVWDNVDFQVLHPQPGSDADMSVTDNNRSCVVKITSVSGSVLLTGDIEKQAESALVGQRELASGRVFLKSDVMIAPHHGSKTSSSIEFIEAVQPGLTIFTTGYLNRFRHPRPEVVKRYLDAQSHILRSDYDGAVTLDFIAGDSVRDSGVTVKASSWRKQNRRYWHDVY